MLTTMKCYPCFFKQALSSAEYVDAPTDKQLDVMREIARILPSFSLDASPAHNSTLALRAANRVLGIDDPYLKAKKHYNEMALDLYPRLEKIVAESDDPLIAAAKLSVVGNVIDLGIGAHIDIEATIGQVFERGFAIDHLYRFSEILREPRSIIFMVDNAGEIVFDKLFIEKLIEAGHDVTVGVKSGPILNDATMDDAKRVGLDKVARIIETGSDWIGTDLATCSEDFKKIYFSSDVAIAKGQANYETIEGTRDNLFMILKAKCDAVAENVGARFGDLIFLESKSDALVKSPKSP